MGISSFHGEHILLRAALFPSIHGPPSSVPDFGLRDIEMTDSWAFQGLTFSFLELSSLESSTSMLLSEARVGSRSGTSNYQLWDLGQVC